MNVFLGLMLAAVLDVSGAKFRFATAPGANPPSQSFRIFNRGDGTLNPVATVPADATWLTVALTGNSGTMSVNSATLPEGIYTTTFTVSDAAAADSPRSIDVQLNVTRKMVTEPASLAIFTPPGVGTFRDIYLPYQSVPTGNIPEWIPSTVTGGNWLTLQLLPENGVYVRANIASTLAEGSYNGSVDYRYKGVIVGTTPIALTVTTRSILSLDRDSVTVETSPGLAVPDQVVQVSNLGKSVLNWSALPDVPWMSAFQDGSALRIVFSTSALKPGTYRGNVVISSNAANAPVTLPVTLRLVALGSPAVKVGGLVDAANYCIRPNCYLAPGSLVSVFGTQLAYAVSAAAATPLPVKLGTTRVLVNGSSAELLFVAYGQVNFHLPATPPGGAKWIVQVERDGVLSNAISASYTSNAPAIFTLDQSGRGYGAILRAGEGIAADASHPVTRGNYVEIYATGLGPGGAPSVVFSGAGITGNVETAPSYAGPAPGFVGLFQINVQVPLSVPATDHLRLQLRTPFNLLSNVVEIAVR